MFLQQGAETQLYTKPGRLILVAVAPQKMEVSNKNQQPTTTLFVVNFDVRKTREADIERYFDK
jgi:hypothetical protein